MSPKSEFNQYNSVVDEDIGDESRGGATGEQREVLHAQVVVCGRFHTMVLLDDAQAQRWVLSLFVCGA